jgi:hypothetical protein
MKRERPKGYAFRENELLTHIPIHPIQPYPVPGLSSVWHLAGVGSFGYWRSCWEPVSRQHWASSWVCLACLAQWLPASLAPISHAAKKAGVITSCASLTSRESESDGTSLFFSSCLFSSLSRSCLIFYPAEAGRPGKSQLYESSLHPGQSFPLHSPSS